MVHHWGSRVLHQTHLYLFRQGDSRSAQDPEQLQLCVRERATEPCTSPSAWWLESRDILCHSCHPLPTSLPRALSSCLPWTPTGAPVLSAEPCHIQEEQVPKTITQCLPSAFANPVFKGTIYSKIGPPQRGLGRNRPSVKLSKSSCL